MGFPSAPVGHSLDWCCHGLGRRCGVRFGMGLTMGRATRLAALALSLATMPAAAATTHPAWSLACRDAWTASAEHGGKVHVCRMDNGSVTYTAVKTRTPKGK